jgi:hypothetical protein
MAAPPVFGQFLVIGVVRGLGSMDLAAEELDLEAGGRL